MAFTQSNRQIQVTTPLGPDELLIFRMEAREELGRLFEFTVDLLSENDSIVLDDLLGKKMTVEMDMVEGSKRYFDGYVSRFTQVGTIAYFAHYRATLRPWLWLLTRTSDCRIFQQKTVPDIVKEVFRDNNFTDFEDKLSNTYREWEYCVQYRETDFNFVSRLMEQEGVYYFFKHEAGKHTLVMCDDYSSHSVLEAYTEIPFVPPSEQGSSRWQDYVFSWKLTKSVQPGRYAHTDYDFTKPKADLHANAPIPRSHDFSEYEIYDYPGAYLESADGSNYARQRIEELQSGHEVLEGEGNARGVSVGGLFTLTEHPRGEQNREYLITMAIHQLQSDAFGAVPGIAQGPVYTCEFFASDSRERFRPARMTAKPMVQGPQTAVVVGKSGEEIYTDEYGRVKLQFHWDRYGSSDENSSCWVRVAQVWSGKNWGAIHIPRIGQEVIVEFLEGDPDRPIITGRVYNANQMPPYDLPANKTQSGIKSRSSKSGSPENFNEIRFEDKKGSEQVYIHAEKNQDNVVENNETTRVGSNRTENVGYNEKITIGNDRTETVIKNEDITIGLNRTEKVGVNESVIIGANRSLQVGANDSETIGGNRIDTIGIALVETVGAAKTETIGAAKIESIGAAKTLNIGGAYLVSIGGASSTAVGGDKTEDVGGEKKVTIGKKLSIGVGASNLTMSSSGAIKISGTDITLTAGAGKIHIDAGGIITIKGPMVKINT